jgi:hypothetical protein
MKRIGTLVLGCLLLLSLLACKTTSQSPTVFVLAPSTTFDVISYATGVDYLVYDSSLNQTPSESHMSVNVATIKYVPYLRTICVSFAFSDFARENARYFALLQNKKMNTTKDQVEFSMPTEYFIATTCFQLPLDGVQYQIGIGKADLDNPNFDYRRIDLSARIEWDDPHFANRKKAESFQIVETTPSETTELSDSFVEYEVTIQDPSAALTEMTLSMYDMSETLVTKRTKDAASIRNGTLIEYKDKVTNLSPKVTYPSMLQVSGHDGIDSFVDFKVKDIVFQAAPHVSQASGDKAHHNVYAFIHDIEDTGHSVILHYQYQNDGSVTLNGSDEPVVLHLERRSKDLPTLSFELTVGLNTLEIPYDQVREEDVFAITDQSGTDRYHQRLIPFVFVSPRFFFGRPYEIYFERAFPSLRVLEIDFYVDGYAMLIEHVVLPPVDTRQPIPTFYQYLGNGLRPILVITIEYEAYGEILTKTYRH